MNPGTPTNPLITGQTRLICIVGDPVAQVRSPEIYNPRLVAGGRNAVLVPLHLPADGFATGMRGLMRLANVAGIILTVPFKELALPLVDRVGTAGAQVGAINVMRREADGSWTGDMFDGAGLLAALQGLGQTAAGRKVTLIGAGGAGSAIGMALAGAGAASIRICDVVETRARSLAERVARFYPACRAAPGPATVADSDLLVNATPIGMAPDLAMAPVAGALHPGLTVIDIVPKPERTKLLETAQAAGCPNANGQAMVAGQADAVLAYLGLGRDGSAR